MRLIPGKLPPLSRVDAPAKKHSEVPATRQNTHTAAHRDDDSGARASDDDDDISEGGAFQTSNVDKTTNAGRTPHVRGRRQPLKHGDGGDTLAADALNLVTRGRRKTASNVSVLKGSALADDQAGKTPNARTRGKSTAPEDVQNQNSKKATTVRARAVKQPARSVVKSNKGAAGTRVGAARRGRASKVVLADDDEDEVVLADDDEDDDDVSYALPNARTPRGRTARGTSSKIVLAHDDDESDDDQHGDDEDEDDDDDDDDVSYPGNTHARKSGGTQRHRQVSWEDAVVLPQDSVRSCRKNKVSYFESPVSDNADPKRDDSYDDAYRDGASNANFGETQQANAEYYFDDGRGVQMPAPVDKSRPGKDAAHEKPSAGVPNTRRALFMSPPEEYTRGARDKYEHGARGDEYARGAHAGNGKGDFDTSGLGGEKRVTWQDEDESHQDVPADNSDKKVTWGDESSVVAVGGTAKPKIVEAKSESEDRKSLQQPKSVNRRLVWGEEDEDAATEARADRRTHVDTHEAKHKTDTGKSESAFSSRGHLKTLMQRLGGVDDEDLPELLEHLSLSESTPEMQTRKIKTLVGGGQSAAERDQGPRRGVPEQRLDSGVDAKTRDHEAAEVKGGGKHVVPAARGSKGQPLVHGVSLSRDQVTGHDEKSTVSMNARGEGGTSLSEKGAEDRDGRGSVVDVKEVGGVVRGEGGAIITATDVKSGQNVADVIKAVRGEGDKNKNKEEAEEEESMIWSPVLGRGVYVRKERLPEVDAESATWSHIEELSSKCLENHVFTYVSFVSVCERERETESARAIGVENRIWSHTEDREISLTLNRYLLVCACVYVCVCRVSHLDIQKCLCVCVCARALVCVCAMWSRIEQLSSK